MSYGSSAEGVEDGEYGGFTNSFTEKAVRLGFIRKVYSILCVQVMFSFLSQDPRTITNNNIQLVVTMGIIGIFTVESVKLYAAGHPEMWWIALVIMIVSLISLACCEGVRRKTPHNFIFLGLFTLAEGFMLGAVTANYRADEVLMAVGVCAAITLGLTIFAFQTKIDFTAMGGEWSSVSDNQDHNITSRFMSQEC